MKTERKEYTLEYRKQAAKKFYISKMEIRGLFLLTKKEADRVFAIAEKLDIEEMGKYRICENKVSTDNVLKVMHRNQKYLDKILEEG